MSNMSDVKIKSDKLEDGVTLEQAKAEYKEAIDIIPALHKYQTEHNSVNLQKLCVEIAEFCQKVYASTRNDDERDIYFSILGKVINRN